MIIIITIIMIMSRDKEGGSHNTADILLSLKNVIVHPGLSPQVLQKNRKLFQKMMNRNKVFGKLIF